MLPLQWEGGGNISESESLGLWRRVGLGVGPGALIAPDHSWEVPAVGHSLWLLRRAHGLGPALKAQPGRLHRPGLVPLGAQGLLTQQVRPCR